MLQENITPAFEEIIQQVLNLCRKFNFENFITGRFSNKIQPKIRPTDLNLMISGHNIQCT